MQSFIVFIVIAIAVSTFSTIENLISPGMNQANISQVQQVGQTGTSQAKPAKATNSISQSQIKTPITVPAVLVDTYIISGPQNGEIIDKTNKVTFEFGAIVSPLNTKGNILFETKVEGLESKWQQTSAQKRTIEFPAGVKEYTFLVRAKINNVIDQTPTKRTFKVNLSPYLGKVKISSVSNSVVTLTSYLNQEEKINITNWKIKGKRGEFTVPQGSTLYIPASFPSNEDIFIKKSDTVYFWASSSPFGINRVFRPNKCFGYLKTPVQSVSSQKICPRINREEICYFSDHCQAFILGLERCTSVDYSKDPQISWDDNCKSYINNYIAENLNYEGCVENYYKDKNFFNNSWYIYIGFDMSCRCSDTLYLYDRNGLLVDSYYYQRY